MKKAYLNGQSSSFLSWNPWQSTTITMTSAYSKCFKNLCPLPRFSAAPSIIPGKSATDNVKFGDSGDSWASEDFQKAIWGFTVVKAYSPILTDFSGTNAFRSVDFPAFGNPRRPMLGRSFRWISTSIFSPFVPLQNSKMEKKIFFNFFGLIESLGSLIFFSKKKNN